MAKRDPTKVISCKDLGKLALADFCPRCFWLERKLGKVPTLFPGIFSTLDSLSKRSTQRSFLEQGRKPGWLPLEGIKRAVKVPRISLPLANYGDWTLTGDPDEVFELQDGSFHVLDYKTAKFTEKQDVLLPMYNVQLNAYGFALSHYGVNPISGLSLLYCEPREDLDTDEDFRVSFKVRHLEVVLDREIIPELLQKAREILNNESPPNPFPKCKGICSWIEKWEIEGIKR